MTPPPKTPAGETPRRRGIQIAAVSALALARLLVLARLLSPDDFGLFAIAVTAVAFVTSLAALGATTAPDDDATWTLGVARGAVLAALLAAIAGPVAALFHDPRATLVLRALALLPLLQALAPPGASRTLADPAANTVIAIALAPFIGVWALVAGALGGAAAGAAASYADAARRPRLLREPARLRPALAFGGWLAVAAALAAATDLVLRATIARRLGAGALGVFALAAGLAFLPVTAAAEAVRARGSAHYVRLLRDPPSLRRAFRALVTGLAAVLVPICAVLAGAADGIADHILGAQWVGVATVLRVLALAGVVGVVSAATVALFHGVGLPRLAVALEIAQLATVAVLAPWFTGARELAGAALAWLGAAAASLVLSRRLLRTVLGPSPGHGYRVGAILGSGVVAGALTFVVTVVIPGAAGVVVGMAVGLAAAAGILRWADRAWRLGMVEDWSWSRR